MSDDARYDICAAAVAKGTIKVTGLAGYVCAGAALLNSAEQTTASGRLSDAVFID